MVAINTALSIGVVTPYLVILPGSIPLVISAVVSVICWSSKFMMPEPGSNLPKTTTDKQGNKTLDRTVANANESIGHAMYSILAPVSHYTLHRFSFQETFMDKTLEVIRPQLLQNDRNLRVGDDKYDTNQMVSKYQDTLALWVVNDEEQD